MKIAVCGAGAAGSYAVKRLRLNLPDAEILLFDAAPVGFYAKMRLPEYLAGTLPREKLILSSPEQMADWGAELHLGEPVTAIDPASHKLTTAAGEYSWDILVLAVGAHAFVPPVPGLSASSRVHVLRELPDADALVALSEPGLNAAVIGGGLLGLEAAWSLHRRGLAVSIIETAPRLLPLQMNEEAGKTATADQAEEIHAYIRSVIADKYGKQVAEDTSILYGGSCKASNAPELFSKVDIDGGLIGGASLKVADFKGIIDAWKK